MNMKLILAAVTAAISVAAPAWADASHSSGQSHYEWRPVPQYGPRATGPAQRRVWVADRTEMANCDCGMMRMSADEGMGSMHRGRDKPSAG